MKLFSRKVPEGRKGFKALFTETAMEIRPLNPVIGLHLVDQALACPLYVQDENLLSGTGSIAEAVYE